MGVFNKTHFLSLPKSTKRTRDNILSAGDFRHEKVRVKSPARMDDVVASVAHLIPEYRSPWHELIHPRGAIPLHDDAQLLAGMPEHTHGPYTDFDWDNLIGLEELFPAVGEVRFRGSGPPLVQFTV